MLPAPVEFTSVYPRSAYDQTCGLVYFARLIEKISLHHVGRLPAAYHANLGGGFDARCCRLLGVTYPALCDYTINGGGTDEQILDWCYAHGNRLSDEQILVWNKFMTKRGWRDEDDGSTQELEAYKAASGLAHRTDLSTFFDYYEVDEGRRA